MSPTLTPSAKTVTARDSRGLKFLEKVGAAYNKAGLTDEEAQRVNEAPGLADLIAKHIAQYRHEIPPVLKLVTGGIKVASAGLFTANKAALKKANIGFTGSNFDDNFLRKAEKDVKDATLAIHRLEKNAVDAVIRKELGQEHEEISLAHFFDLLTNQSKGQEGHLLVDGNANIAYIRDKNGTLWAVYAGWRSGRHCWDVRAYPVEYPVGWRAGDRVISSDC